MTEAIQARGFRNTKQHGNTGGFASSNPPVNTQPYVPRGGKNRGALSRMCVFVFVLILLFAAVFVLISVVVLVVSLSFVNGPITILILTLSLSMIPLLF
jgi:hypothetical protein